MNKMAEEKINGSSNPIEIGQARMVKAMIANMCWTISLAEDGSASFSREEGDYLQKATGNWVSADGVVTQELNLVVVNQRDLYHGDTQFKNALRIVAEEKLRNNSAAPDM